MNPEARRGSYEARLHLLAESHGLQPAELKRIIEDAFGTPDAPPSQRKSRKAKLRLAQLKVGPCELNLLFQYHIVKGDVQPCDSGDVTGIPRRSCDKA